MPDEIKPVYSGEAQLVRWADSGAAGRTITLRIDEHTDVHPFKGLKYGDSGQRFEIAVVAKNDDEEPLDPEHAKKNAKRLVARKKNGPDDAAKSHLPTHAEPAKDQDSRRTFTRSQMAAIKLTDTLFIDWLAELKPEAWRAYSKLNAPIAEAADYTLKELLGIQSKRELDSNPEKAAEWDRLIATYDVRDMVRR